MVDERSTGVRWMYEAMRAAASRTSSIVTWGSETIGGSVRVGEMTGVISAGILLHRTVDGRLELLIAHPGGPFWANKDEGAWSIPKGLVEEGEDPALAAVREFTEETGCAVDPEALEPLGSVTLRSRKTVVAFAVEGSCDPAAITSNTFEIEWPPRSGRRRSFPEIDRVEWVSPEEARTRLNAAQRPLVDRLMNALGST